MQLTILRRTKSTASSSRATAGKMSRGSEEKGILGSRKEVQRINSVFGGIGASPLRSVRRWPVRFTLNQSRDDVLGCVGQSSIFSQQRCTKGIPTYLSVRTGGMNVDCS